MLTDLYRASENRENSHVAKQLIATETSRRECTQLPETPQAERWSISFGGWSELLLQVVEFENGLQGLFVNFFIFIEKIFPRFGWNNWR